LGEARHEYEQLLSKWPSSVYATEARSRLDDLNKQTTKEFYDWFATQNTKALGGGAPGIPGQKPSGLPENEPETPPAITPPSTSAGQPETKPADKKTDDPKTEEKKSAAPATTSVPSGGAAAASSPAASMPDAKPATPGDAKKP
jgi:hypothetical protein